MNTNFKVWPIGKVPIELQRPELGLLRDEGYEFDDPREVVYVFEKKMAEYSGSKYAVAVDNCTDAIFLCLQYWKYIGSLKDGDVITIPNRCYLSIPMVIKQLNLIIKFEDREWSGLYQLKPTIIYDSAVRFTKGMYKPNSYQCISFQIKKQLPIGKGGMILTNSRKADTWFRQASFEGRHIEKDQWNDKFDIIGWNMYMAPEDAARGILLFDKISKVNNDVANQDSYPDLSKQEIFKNV